MIAICGLTCTDCPAYIATQEDDDQKRKKIAEQWSSDEFPVVAEDINCDGCIAVGKRQIKFCTACDVRQCGMEKKVENCAYCDDYACEKLEKIWDMIKSPAAKTTLDGIRAQL